MICLPAGAKTFDNSDFLTRGQTIDTIVNYFDLKRKNADFLEKCHQDIDFCIFAFGAKSGYDDIRINPLILYPDVFPAHPYYESINLATKLDLVQGYIHEENSPFKPQQQITRIEALKVILGASGAINWKEKFEIEELLQELQFEYNKISTKPIQDILKSPDLWWKTRYIVFGYQNDVISMKNDFDPDSKITEKMLYQLLESTNKLVADEEENYKIEAGIEDNKQGWF